MAALISLPFAGDVASALFVLQAMKNWMRAWERGYEATCPTPHQKKKGVGEPDRIFLCVCDAVVVV